MRPVGRHREGCLDTVPAISPPAAVDTLALLLARLDAALDGVALRPLDEARFLETHAIYEERSDQRHRIIEWFGERIAPAVPPEQPFRVLSVGCGGGDLDLPVVRRLAERTRALHYLGVNPNRVECDAFAARFREAAPDGTHAEVVPDLFEDFAPPHAFHLIHFVHCLYYMSDPAATLARALRMLAPGGRLVVFQAPRAALNQLATRFYDRQYARPTPFAEHLAPLFDGWGRAFKHERIDAFVDMTPFLRGDPVLGPALRDFVVQVDGRRLPKPVQALVERYLRRVAAEDAAGARIPHPVDAFLIGE